MWVEIEGQDKEWFDDEELGGLMHGLEQDRQCLVWREQTATPLYQIIRAALQSRDLGELRRARQLLGAWYAVETIQ